VDALTEADVLGIYGRESLGTLRIWWNVPETDRRRRLLVFVCIETMDGAGGQFGRHFGKFDEHGSGTAFGVWRAAVKRRRFDGGGHHKDHRCNRDQPGDREFSNRRSSGCFTLQQMRI